MSKDVKVQHPDFGHVIFTNPTPRQKDVLLFCQEYLAVGQVVKKKVLKALDEKKEEC